MEIIAHRGADHHIYGENTLLAFRQAQRLGCDGIELDVRLTKDLKLIVCHDEEIRRAGEQYRIREYTLQQLIRFGVIADSIRDAIWGNPVPTLRLVLTDLVGSIPINIELKDRGSAAPLATLFDDLNIFSPYLAPYMLLVSSFHLQELLSLKSLSGRIQLCALISRLPWTWCGRKRLSTWLMAQNISGLHISLPSADRRTVRFFAKRGFNVRVYTVNDAGLLFSLMRYGVGGVFTDSATKFVAWKKVVESAVYR